MKEKILVSLVIPVFNESKTISALISTINEQSLQPDEVILVDAGSTDNTVALVKELSVTNQRFRIIKAGRAMPGKGRNIGAEAAVNEWIAFTDAGIQLSNDWLEHLVIKAEEQNNIAIVYGNYSPVTTSFFEKCAAISYVPPQHPGKIRGHFIASSLFKKEVWKKIGGFPDWRAAEDLIFMENAEKAGYKYEEVPDAMVYWQLRQDIKTTYQKFRLYSMHNVWAGKQHHWHYGIAKQYGIIILFGLLAVIHSWYWLLLVPVLMAARTAKRIFSHRYEFGTKILFNPVIFFMVMWITVVIDVATFSGWIKALSNKEGHRNFSLEP